MDKMAGNMFILLTTENGNGYVDDRCQKVVSIAYDEETIQNIFNIFFLINKSNTRNRRMLNFNIIDHDMTVLNIDYLGRYEEMIDYKQTTIMSIDIDDEVELSNIMINIFEKMQECPCIKQVLYSRRKKYNGTKKVFFFLIKVFVDKKIPIADIKKDILTERVVYNKTIKLKVNDIDVNRDNKLEQGVKKNNWINL